MASAKKLRGPPAGACPYCWENHPAEYFVSPSIPENPDIILVLGHPTQADVSDGGQLRSAAGKELRRIIAQTKITPIILYARQCYRRSPPTTKQIHINREYFLLPILEKYPHLPIVTMGRHAAVYLQGGQIPKKEPPANRTRIIFDRLVAFTYDTDFYLEKEEEGGAQKAAYVLEHIRTTIKSAITPPPTIPFVSYKLPTNVKRIVVDIEGPNAEYTWYGGEIAELGIKPIGGTAFTIRWSEVTQEFKDLLNSQTELVVGHDLSFDLIVLAQNGIAFPKAKFHDTLIYHRNLFPNERFNGLKPLAKKYFGFHHWDAWFSTKFHNKESIYEINETKLFVYNAWDLLATETLYLNQQKPYVPFRLEMDYMAYVTKMIQNGMHVDQEGIEKLRIDVAVQLEKLQAEIREEFALGEDFNFDSVQQVTSFIKRYVPDLSDTTKDSLLKVKDKHPFIERLLAIKKLSKFLGTGIEGLIKRIAKDACVHSRVQVHGAETGRSSSSAPNLQNTDPKIRSYFNSRFGKEGRLVHTDLASLEYRLIAHATADPKLLRIFRNGEDIHANAYRDVYSDWPPDKVERKKGKLFNFGGVYGCGLSKFLDLAQLDRKTGEPIFKKMQYLYPGVVEWKANMIRNLRKTGQVRNLFGRVRQFEFPITNNDEREAFNWIIQSSGHDILKIYLMEVADRVAAACKEAILISEVHDSMTFDVPAHEAEKVREIMSSVGGDLNPLIWDMFGVKMRIPMFAEIEVLEAWA